MATERKRRALGELAEASAPDTVDLWPEIRTRAVRTARARTTGRYARLATGLAVALLLALVAAISTLWSSPQPASAEAILARAQSAAGATGVGRSYHLQMVSRSDLKPLADTRREAWFDGNRARQTFSLLDSSGAVKTTIDVIYDGTQSWSVVTADGHVNVVHSLGDDLKARAEGIGQQDSLASFLALYNNDRSCMTAQIRGESTVSGRPTYAIAVEPNPSRCGAEPANDPATGAKQPPAPDKQPIDQEAAQAKAQKALNEMVIWVDKETYLPLKTQTLDVAGEVLDESVATSVQYDVTLPDSLFSYTPPAGATVIEAADKPGGRTAR